MTNGPDPEEEGAQTRAPHPRTGLSSPEYIQQRWGFGGGENFFAALPNTREGDREAELLASRDQWKFGIDVEVEINDELLTRFIQSPPIPGLYEQYPDDPFDKIPYWLIQEYLDRENELAEDWDIGEDWIKYWGVGSWVDERVAQAVMEGTDPPFPLRRNPNDLDEFQILRKDEDIRGRSLRAHYEAAKRCQTAKQVFELQEKTKERTWDDPKPDNWFDPDPARLLWPDGIDYDRKNLKAAFSSPSLTPDQELEMMEVLDALDEVDPEMADLAIEAILDEYVRFINRNYDRTTPGEQHGFRREVNKKSAIHKGLDPESLARRLKRLVGILVYVRQPPAVGTPRRLQHIQMQEDQEPDNNGKWVTKKRRTTRREGGALHNGEYLIIDDDGHQWAVTIDFSKCVVFTAKFEKGPRNTGRKFNHWKMGKSLENSSDTNDMPTGEPNRLRGLDFGGAHPGVSRMDNDFRAGLLISAAATMPWEEKKAFLGRTWAQATLGQAMRHDGVIWQEYSVLRDNVGKGFAAFIALTARATEGNFPDRKELKEKFIPTLKDYDKIWQELLALEAWSRDPYDILYNLGGLVKKVQFDLVNQRLDGVIEGVKITYDNCLKQRWIAWQLWEHQPINEAFKKGLKKGFLKLARAHQYTKLRPYVDEFFEGRPGEDEGREDMTNLKEDYYYLADQLVLGGYVTWLSLGAYARNVEAGDVKRVLADGWGTYESPFRSVGPGHLPRIGDREPYKSKVFGRWDRPVHPDLFTPFTPEGMQRAREMLEYFPFLVNVVTKGIKGIVENAEFGEQPSVDEMYDAIMANLRSRSFNIKAAIIALSYLIDNIDGEKTKLIPVGTRWGIPAPTDFSGKSTTIANTLIAAKALKNLRRKLEEALLEPEKTVTAMVDEMGELLARSLIGEIAGDRGWVDAVKEKRVLSEIQARLDSI